VSGAAHLLAAAAAKPRLSNGELVVRLLVALALGGVIGFEREVSHQPAGLRTHIGVALGAALFGILSVHGFDAYAQDRNSNNYQIDVTRVASQVVVGIGFLGGGTILKHGASIRGLTTAASLWVVAAVGLAAGVGSHLAATVTTGALVLSLVGLRAPRERIRFRLARGRGTAVIQIRPDGDLARVVQAILALRDVTLRDITVNRRDKGTTIEVDMVGPVGKDLSTVLAPVANLEDVADVDIA
jgi:putative Mg2+ transporter-C (MgtC) family protein